MNIYVIGYTYSGKTTYGRQLAAERGMDFLDTDQTFEARFHYTIRDFFARFGEAAFRQLEREVLRSTAELSDTVVATGGGTPCFFDNMDFILAHGHVVYLRRTVGQILERVRASRNTRPQMLGLDDDQRRLKIAEQLALREPFYLRAHEVVDL